MTIRARRDRAVDHVEGTGFLTRSTTAIMLDRPTALSRIPPKNAQEGDRLERAVLVSHAVPKVAAGQGRV